MISPRVVGTHCFALAAMLIVLASPLRAQDYQIKRIASGLNQPTYVTQAPSDPTNILYYSERTTNTLPNFQVVNNMGGIYRYDVTTQSKTLILDFSSRRILNDDGLQTFAFNPDFNNSGTAGYGKMYVSSAEYTGTGSRGASGNSGTVPTDRVEEFTVLNSNGTFKTPAQAFATAKTILQYTNNTQNNHTVDWVGFDPTAAGSARNYLYISTGDASFGNAYNGGISPTGRPSQNPSDVRGKFLRVDISGADDYPADPNKNFAIPPSNPIPTYNAAHPGSPITGVGEVYVTGVRNGYRVSFDRANGDLYWGDVGENNVEEIDTLRAGTNLSGPPVDYGWPQREGMSTSGVSGTSGTTTNTFTGVTALNPIQVFSHTAGGNAAIGGYIYHGPIPSLQGKFLYADFVPTNDAFLKPQLYMLDFDRNTNPATFNGNNGTLTDVSALWNSLVVDPNDPNYPADNLPGGGISGKLDHIVSYGEDNAGNVYLVDFGSKGATQGTFDGEYPAAGLGEIFMLVPVPEPSAAWLMGIATALFLLRFGGKPGRMVA